MMSVLNGRRDVAFLLDSTVSQNIELIKSKDVKLMVVKRDGYGDYGDGFILYADRTKADRLKKIMDKNQGYLMDESPEDTIENGEALEYDDNDIREYVDSHYGDGVYDSVKNNMNNNE